MPMNLQRITIRGFKSFRDVSDFPLRDINVLVGANGSGKSNFVEALDLPSISRSEMLDEYCRNHGGVESFFHNTTAPTDRFELEFHFTHSRHELYISSRSGVVDVTKDILTLYGNDDSDLNHKIVDLKAFKPNKPSMTADRKILFINTSIAHALFHTPPFIYDFKDLGDSFPPRKPQYRHHARKLLRRADNLSEFLASLQHERNETYERLKDAIQSVAPFIEDFILPEYRDRAPSDDLDKTRLRWRHAGSSTIYEPWQLSDGTLRFICLATALLQPDPPPTIVFDEPELGLHPFALAVLAGLVHDAAARTQVVMATQSPSLVNHFSPEDVIVADRVEGATQLRRLDAEDLRDWLEDYALGELWEKNVLGGGPRHA